MANSTEIPTIDYSSRDFASLQADLVALAPTYLPEWTNRSSTSFGMAIINLFAYMGDILSYYIDRAANEAYIATAVQRASILSLAAALDYRPTGLAASSVEMSFAVPTSHVTPVLIPAGTQVSTPATTTSDPIVFETDEDLTVAAGSTDTVTATEGRTVNEDATRPVGVSSGGADQVFALYYPSVIDNSLHVLVDEDGTGGASAIEWHFIDHLIDATSSERAYTTFVDENGVVSVIFGDGANGRIPPQGAIITATYRVGIGTRGNVGSGTITQAVNSLTGVTTIINPAPASGGADAETIESIRRNAPRSLRALNRAVTSDDYEALAKRVSGVALARAVVAIYTAPEIFIAPVGGGNPSVALQNSVLNYLADKKPDPATVTLSNPTYVPVNITLNPLNVLPQYNRTAVQLAVEAALEGLFELQKVDFGFRVGLSLVYRTIAAVEGVDYAVVTVLSLTGSGLADVVVAADEIPTAGTISITATGGLVGS